MTKTALALRWAAVFATPTALIMLIIHNPSQLSDLLLVASTGLLGAAIGTFVGEVRGMDW